MIVLYRRPDDAWADEVQDALDEMVIAYDTRIVHDPDDLPPDVPETPALRDDDEVVVGEDALRVHLDELRALMADWDRFQADACYVEADGSIC
jgi:hypothetical protein